MKNALNKRMAIEGNVSSGAVSLMFFVCVDIKAMIKMVFCDLPYFHNALLHYIIRHEFFSRSQRNLLS